MGAYEKDAINGKMIAKIPRRAKLFRITKEQNGEFFKDTEDKGSCKLTMDIIQDYDFENLKFLNSLLVTRDYSDIIDLMNENIEKKEYRDSPSWMKQYYQKQNAWFDIFWKEKNRDFLEKILLEMTKDEPEKEMSPW